MFTYKNMTGNNNHDVLYVHVYVYLGGQMGFFM